MQTKRFSWARLHHALARRRCVQKYVPPYYAVALRALRRRKLRGTPPLSHAWVATSATSTL